MRPSWTPLIFAALLAVPALAEEGMTLVPTRSERAMLPHGTTKLVFSAAEKAEYDNAVADAVKYAEENCAQAVRDARAGQILSDIDRAATSMNASLNDEQSQAVLAAIPQRRVLAPCKAAAKPDNLRSCLVLHRTPSGGGDQGLH